MKKFILLALLVSHSAFAVFDSNDLQELIAANDLKDSDAFMVWQNGQLLYSMNTDETKQYSIQSVTKSLTAMTIACILGDNLAQLDESHLFPEWEGTPKVDITLRHVLSMNSGIVDAGNAWGKRDFYAHAASKPLTHIPGTTFEYANSSIMLAGKWIRDTTGQQFSFHAKRCFFDALGITDWRIGKDAMRNEVVAGGVRIKADDLLKIGIMLAQDGVYEGQQLLSKVQIAELRRDTLDDGNPYGLAWWLRGSKVFNAAGHLGQYLVIVPSEKLVVLRLRNRDNMQSTPANVANWFKELPGIVARLIK